MKKVNYKVESLADYGVADFGLYAIVDGQTKLIIDRVSACRYLKRKYGCFLYLDSWDDNYTKQENIEEAQIDFSEDFMQWKVQNETNISRMYIAMTSEYSPIENYDRIEEGTITDAHHKGSRTSFAKDETTTPNLTTTVTPDLTTTNTPNLTTTNTPNLTTTNTPNLTTTVTPDLTTETTPNTTVTATETPRAKTKNTEYVYGFNSTAETPSSSTVSEVLEGTNQTATVTSGSDTTTQTGTNTTTQTGINTTSQSGTDTTTQTGTNTTKQTGTDTTLQTGTTNVTADAENNYTETTDISDTVFDKDQRSFEGYRIHGNIGVTKTQEMISSELELRSKTLAYMLLDTFIREHCYYVDCMEVVE